MNEIKHSYNTDVFLLQSTTIDILRFPLAIMVVFIHMNPKVTNLLEIDYNLLSCHGIKNLIGILFSHVIASIAVPTFYIISGFLFFINFQKWNWADNKSKIRKRVKSLVIPYFLWNFVPFILYIIFMLVGVCFKGNSISNVYSYIQEYSWHIFYDCNEWGTTQVNWLGDNLRMTGPYNLPLWFLRDLIVLTFLNPLIYFIVKRIRISALFILFIAYISRIWTQIPGFQITAFFYFTTGAYFALNNLNIVSFAKRFNYLFLPVCIICLFITTIYDGVNTVVGQFFCPFFVFSGVFTTFYIASLLIKRYKIKPNKFLVSSSFFIYAFHVAYLPIIGNPLSFSQNILHKLIPGNTCIEDCICYMASPFLTIIICLLVLSITRKFLPKTTLLFTGNK